MLLVDDLLAAPVKGFLWIFHEIHKAATEEQAARRDQIMAALSALYVSLEQHEITDADFDTREHALLDELDDYDARADADDAGDETDGDEEADDEEAQADPDAGSTVAVCEDFPAMPIGLVGAQAPSEPAAPGPTVKEAPRS